jgi:hypothetical protein
MARVKGAYGVPPGSPTLDPHRTDPKVGSYRGDAGGLPVRLTRNRQLWLGSRWRAASVVAGVRLGSSAPELACS